MENRNPLSISEQEQISAAILQMVASYTDFPSNITSKKIFWQHIEPSGSVGVFGLTGAVYLRRYVSGNFRAQFPFCIRYTCSPTSNADRIDKRAVLDKLADWICNKIEYPDLTDGRTIDKIEQTSVTTLAGVDDNGNELYQCNFVLEYSKVS